MTPEDVERFWNGVKKSDGCWEWTRCREATGYGRMKFGGITRRTHRVAWFIRHREWPKLVLHRCDNPPCVRIDHLYVGTYSDNNRDMEERGRMSRGERHYNAKLTEHNVRAMRRLREYGWTYKGLAEAFQVGTATVQQIITRKRWRHV